MSEPFKFLPGERILQIVGLPGPDTDDCEVVEDDGGDTVLIRFQVYGAGPVHEKRVARDMLMWARGSATAERHSRWLTALGGVHVEGCTISGNRGILFRPPQ